MINNAIYPDNPNREIRAIQLASDCTDLVSALKCDKEIIEKLMAEANEIIIAAYKDKTNVPFTDYSSSEVIDYGIWPSYVVMGLVSFAVMPVVNNFLVSLFKPAVAGQRFGVQLSTWLFKCTEFASSTVSFVGGMAGGIIAGLLVASIVDSIDGAVYRKNLRDKITSSIEPRIELKKNVMLSNEVKLTLGTVIVTFRAFKNVPGITDEQLTSLTKQLVDKHKDDITEITRDAAIKALEQYDKDRNSWTEEDHYS
jgi:hypothetical protein